MTKKLLITVLALLGFTSQILADNLRISDVSIEQAGSAVAEICLNNTSTNYVGFQMDVMLPTGISISKSLTALSDRAGSGGNVTIGKQLDGSYRLVYSNMNLVAFSGTSGVLVNLGLTASAAFEGGTVEIKNIIMGTASSEKKTLNNVSFSVVKKAVEVNKEDSLYVSPFSMNKGADGDVKIKLSNKEEKYIAFQFDLFLPDGFIAKTTPKGKYLATVNEDRSEDGNHTVSGAEVSGGAIRFVCVSMSNSLITGKDGLVLTIPVAASDSLELGEYYGFIRNVKLTTASLTTEKVLDAQFIIKLGKKGDANGDGVVDVTDVATTISYALENNPSPFFFDNADVNENGIVDVTDVASIIAIILSEE